MATLDSALGFAERNRTRTIRELAEFLRFPSVSIDPSARAQVRACAAWLAQHLGKMGLDRVEMVATKGHPVVLASHRHAQGAPTLLVYGHYDVQPVEPLAAWRQPPFVPRVADGKIFARGASDDKGQLFAHVKAIEAFLKSSGRLPINVQLVFEGEEEIDSLHFRDFIEANRSRLAADVAVISDTRMLGKGRPTLTYSLRGHLRLEIEVRTLVRDVHSGNFGGAVPSALEIAARVAAGFHRADGGVAIPGFYAGVKPVDAAEKARMADAGPSDNDIAMADFDWGESNFTAYEKTTIRPSLSVTGIVGGHAGSGVKAVIAAASTIKVSIRWVHNQDPAVLVELVREHAARVAGDYGKIAVRIVSSAAPVELSRQHPALHAADRALRLGFGKKPLLIRSGGTIGVVDLFKSELHIPTVLMGFGLPGDAAHGVNEKLDLSQLCGGIRASAAFMWELRGLPVGASE